MDDRETVSRSVAVERLLDLAAARDGAGTERVPLDGIAGRVLAEPVEAPADVPGRDMATMDGYAVATDDDGPRRVVGEVFPEDDPPGLDRGDAVGIATGAPLPDRADAVLMREDATVADGDLSGPALDPGTNVYPAGATASAGERLFDAGERLAPRHAALLRDAGVDAVTAHRPQSVAVLATGSEIHEGRQPDRDSEALANLLRRWGHDPTIRDPVPDDPDLVRAAIRDAAAGFDAVLTTGGTSVGHADHVVRVLRDHDVLFRGVAVRPGRPLTVAVVEASGGDRERGDPAGTPVCALPGKPMAAHTAATLVLRPLFAGESRFPTVAADLAVDLAVPDADVTFAVPVTLDGDAATPLGHAASSLSLYGERFAPGRVAASTRASLADGVLLTREDLDAGQRVRVLPYEVVE